MPWVLNFKGVEIFIKEKMTLGYVFSENVNSLHSNVYIGNGMLRKPHVSGVVWNSKCWGHGHVGMWGSLYNDVGTSEAVVFRFCSSRGLQVCFKDKETQSLVIMTAYCRVLLFLGIDQGKQACWSAWTISSPIFFWKIVAIWTYRMCLRPRKKNVLWLQVDQTFPLIQRCLSWKWTLSVATWGREQISSN